MEAAPNPWEFGWEALVALATLALAAATGVLAVATLKTARAGAIAAKATEIDVRAQWRPAIAPTTDIEVDYHPGDAPDRGTVSLHLRNVGQGAALRIDAGLEDGTDIVPGANSAPGRTEPRNYAILAAGEEAEFLFSGIEARPEGSTLYIDYEDLNGRPYATRAVVREIYPEAANYTGKAPLALTSIVLSEGETILPWNDPANYRSAP